jgi:hypothetical protein
MGVKLFSDDNLTPDSTIEIAKSEHNAFVQYVDGNRIGPALLLQNECAQRQGSRMTGKIESVMIGTEGMPGFPGQDTKKELLDFLRMTKAKIFYMERNIFDDRICQTRDCFCTIQHPNELETKDAGLEAMDALPTFAKQLNGLSVGAGGKRDDTCFARREQANKAILARWMPGHDTQALIGYLKTMENLKADTLKTLSEFGVERAFQYEELNAFEFEGSPQERKAAMARSSEEFARVLKALGVPAKSEWVRRNLPGAGTLPRSETKQSSKVFDYETVATELREAGLGQLLHD